MKILHLSDLHIGKKVHEIPMLREQEHIFTQIYEIIKNEDIECVLIAGDVYDKSIPTTEAIKLFDSFITNLSKMDVRVCVISGNHDNVVRLSFGSEIMSKENIFVSPEYNGEVKCVSMADEYGDISIYMLPFVKPADIRPYFPDENIESYNDALKCVVDSIDMDDNKRNILMAHQFVTGAQTGGSETSIGGLDNIDAAVFDKFDYVALGHIHKAQYVSKENIRYPGTILKYSFSEINNKNNALIVDIKAKNDTTSIEYKKIPLEPLHNMQQLKGQYEELMSRDFYSEIPVDDYMHIILTDEELIEDASARLRVVYPNLMWLEYENTRTGYNQEIEAIENIEKKSELELLMEFYEIQNNREMSEEQLNYARGKIEKIWRRGE